MNAFPKTPGLVLLLALPLAAGAQQLPPEGVLFDDFAYRSTAFVHEVNTCADATCALVPPDSASLYGHNVWHTSTDLAETDTARLWYRKLWREPSHDTFEGWSVGVDPAGSGQLVFTFRAGPDYRHPERDRENYRQELVSGFAARRGTWAALVQLDSLGRKEDAGITQAFWLVSPYIFRDPAQETPQTLWNEVDFEYVNWWFGAQDFDYINTAYRGGDGRSFLNLPMAALDDADPRLAGNECTGILRSDGVNFDGPSCPEHPYPAGTDTLAWTCTYTWEEGALRHRERLPREACGRALAGHLPRAPEQAPRAWMLLLMQVTDETVAFELASHGEGGQIQMRSRRHYDQPVPDLPLVTYFDQHLSVPGDAPHVILPEPVTFKVDWFYYSPSTSVSLEEVEAHVRYLQEDLRTPRFNSTGLSPERPYAHYPGFADPRRFPGRTTSLEGFRVEHPEMMQPGERARLVMLPPLRNGIFEATWWYTRYGPDGARLDAAPVQIPDRSFSLDYAFPPEAAEVVFTARLREYHDDGRLLAGGPAAPRRKTFSICNRQTGCVHKDGPPSGR